MSRLIRIDQGGKLKQLEPAPFDNEVDELKSYIIKNPAVLGDNITIIAKELEIRSISKRLDILALEEFSKDIAKPVVVELKNDEADTFSLLQVLGYASWVLNSPDSVYLHASRLKYKVKEIDNSSVKVIIVAPAFKKELRELSRYITDSIEFGFLEFQRFADTNGDLLVLDWKAHIMTPVSITRAQQDWNWEKYESELDINPQNIEIGKHLYNGLVQLNDRKEWGLSPVFRKYYIPFKYSWRNVVLIEYNAKFCWLTVKLPKSPKELGLHTINPDLEEYEKKYKQYSFKVTTTDINIADFSDYIEKALELL